MTDTIPAPAPEQTDDEPETGVVVVALPAATDPITAASSEQPGAHMTLVFLGDSTADAGTVGADALAAAVADWAAKIDGPITEGVAGRATLGTDQADVVLIDAASFAEIRNGMAAADSGAIGTVTGHVTQFPVWTPHVTLGYPDTPAAADYAGESVTFDRLALWYGDDYREFPLGAAADTPDATPEPKPLADPSPGDTSFALVDAPSAVPADEAPAAPADEDEDDIDEPVTVPFHGVAAPMGLESGDRRMFAEGSLSWRNLPLPLTYQFIGTDGHDQRVTVGRIDQLWVNDRNEVEFSGEFASPTLEPYVDKVIGGIIEGWIKGVSVDLDKASWQIPDVKDVFESEEEVLDAMFNKPVDVVTDGRISAICIVDIPAFQEAYIALGEAPCVDCAAEPTADVELPDDDTALAAAAFRQGLAALIDDDPELTAFARSVPSDPDTLASLDAVVAAAFAPGTHDGPGWITAPRATQRIRNYWVRGEGAAKIKWGVGGDFNRCRSQLAKYVQNPDWLAGLCANMHKEALGVWPGQEDGGALAASAGVMAPAYRLVEPEPEALVAAGVPVVPPREWFQNPNLDGPTPLTVTDDGRVFGHAAQWGVCHIGLPVCTTAPHSATGYAYFQVGLIRTTDGDVPVGHITMATGHAGLKLSAQATAAHYDNTSNVAADVAAGEDAYGIWVAGAARPNLDEQEIRELRAAVISGDWREIRGNLEMVAAHAVNTPGFPIPRTALAASGHQQTALIAAGIVQREDPQQKRLEASTALVNAVADAIEHRAAVRSRTAAARTIINQERISAARRIIDGVQLR